MSKSNSSYRRSNDYLSSIKADLNEALSKLAKSPETKAELEITNEKLRELKEQKSELEELFSSLENEKKDLLLVKESAKHSLERIQSDIEKNKYQILMNMFPSMEDSAKLILSRILSIEECLVCGADAENASIRYSELLSKQQCPICEATPDNQKHHNPGHEFQQKKRDQLGNTFEKAQQELVKATEDFEFCDEHYSKTLKELIDVSDEIKSLEKRKNVLISDLPKSADEIRGLEATVSTLTEKTNDLKTTYEKSKGEFEKTLKKSNAEIIASAKDLSSKFSKYVDGLLAENAKLFRSMHSAKLDQSGNYFDVPSYVPEMEAAARPGYPKRLFPTDVSESQRELINLAFRLALIDVATDSNGGSFVMETPEASLDGIAMERVGLALKEFYSTTNNSLIITNNLSNAGLITALLGGATDSNTEIENRKKMVFNLLKNAAPNKALSENFSRYQTILDNAISG